jgi:transposase
MNYSCYVGIDVSKASFDAYFVISSSSFHKVFSNNEEGFKGLVIWLKSNNVDLSSSLFCAEAMGNYVLDLSVWLYNRRLTCVLACPLDIKKSMGIQRGKSDKIDAYKIALYAKKNVESLELFAPKEATVVELNSWLIIRSQLVKQQTSYSKLLKQERLQSKHYNKKEQIEFLEAKLGEIKQEIKHIETQMKTVIQAHSNINKNVQLLESITGIGFLNACVLICATHNFTKFENHTKFACYSGIAPFEYSSGSSIRGKTKVSALANKKVKTYLTSAAITAVRWDKQLKAYYHRKLNEGKHKASVLNAIKAKLVARCFAVIKRQKPFVKLDY